jgi:type IV secretory pathway VirB10-like protein
MMRLLGVLVGSALAVAALVVFVGIPRFTTESSVAERTVITLPMRSDPPPQEPEPEAPQQETPVAASTPPPTDPPAPAETVAAVTEAAPAAAETTAAETERPPAPRWYAFWSPFRSEIAANGFVEQLQRVTGLDYRVVKVQPGTYEVAFAYDDDQDISINLSRISAATGLQLPEG